MLIRFVRNEVLAGQCFHTGHVRDLPMNIAIGCMQRGSAVRADKPEPTRLATVMASVSEPLVSTLELLDPLATIPAPPAIESAPPMRSLWSRARALIERMVR